MSEQTVTKEQLVEAMVEEGFHFDDIDPFIAVLFPPPFEPKKGQVIAVSGECDFVVPAYGKYSHMNGRFHRLLNSSNNYLYARPLTPEEIG